MTDQTETLRKAWADFKGGKRWSERQPVCRTETSDTHHRHDLFMQGWFAALSIPPALRENATQTEYDLPADHPARSSWGQSALDEIDRLRAHATPPTAGLDVESWTQELALIIAKARFGPGVDMGGRHNPLPTEIRNAKFFVEAILDAALATLPAEGLDEEHCCNDPSHMSAEYLAEVSGD